MVSESQEAAGNVWLTAAEAASYLSLALGTVRNLTSARRVPHVRQGGIVRYHRGDLDRWLRRGQCHGRSTLVGHPRPASEPDATR